MLQELLHPELPPGARAVGARVEVLWPPETDTAEESVTWNEGVVASVHEDGSYTVRVCNYTERGVAPWRVRVPRQGEREQAAPRGG